MSSRSLSFVLVFAALSAPVAARAGDAETQLYGKALDFLLEQQQPNGGFGQIPGEPPGELGITGLVVKALADAPAAFQKKTRPAAEKAAAYIVANQQPNGSFTHERSGLSTYRTALAISALHALDAKKYQDQIEKATTWLKADQFDEPDGVDKDSPHYGGWGYAEHGENAPDADMSNTLIALSALKDAGLKPDDPVYQRALVFLSRSQNNSETNPGIGGLKAGNDGGFIYDPGLSRNKSAMTENADGTRSFESYASITYSGLMSLIHAGLGPDDSRVAAAKRWIGAHYTLEENYGLGLRQKDPEKAGQQGLFYYYHAFAKCLAALGSPTVETADGPQRWADDLCAALATRQNDDGSFSNPVDRWWEKDPVLATAYALNALNYALPFVSPESE